MAKQLKLVSTSTGTGSTTDVTSSGIGTLDGAIFILTGVAGEDTDYTGIEIGQYFWDTSNTLGVTAFSKHGVDTTSANSATIANVTLHDGTAASSWECVGTISAITDGFRITWTTSPSISLRLDAILIAGGLEVNVGELLASNIVDGTVSYSGATATPDLVFFQGCWLSSEAPDYTNNDHTDKFGFAVNDGSESQFCADIRSRTGRPVGDVLIMNHTNRVSTIFGDYSEKELTSFDTNGFTITTRVGTSANNYLQFLAISGLANVALDTGLSTATTGSKSITGIGFEPDFAFMVRNRCTALDTKYTNLNNRMTFGATDGTNEFTTTQHEDDGAGVSDTGQRHSVSKILDSYQTEGEDIAATFTSFDSGGLTINVSSAGVSTGATLLIQADAGSEPPATDDSVPWMSFF